MDTRGKNALDVLFVLTNFSNDQSAEIRRLRRLQRSHGGCLIRWFHSRHVSAGLGARGLEQSTEMFAEYVLHLLLEVVSDSLLIGSKLFIELLKLGQLLLSEFAHKVVADVNIVALYAAAVEHVLRGGLLRAKRRLLWRLGLLQCNGGGWLIRLGRFRVTGVSPSALAELFAGSECLLLSLLEERLDVALEGHQLLLVCVEFLLLIIREEFREMRIDEKRGVARAILRHNTSDASAHR